MSKFLIDFLVKQEIIGAGVEKPFDKSTLLAAAKAVSEKFRTSCDVAKVENRLKSFITKWTKVEKLKHLNGASWDPITKIISLRGDHYRDYVKVSNTYLYLYLKCTKPTRTIACSGMSIQPFRISDFTI